MELQEFGQYVEIEGHIDVLSQAFRVANRFWRGQLGLKSDPFHVLPTDRGVEVRAQGVTGQVRVAGHLLRIRPKFLELGALERWEKSLVDILGFTERKAFAFFGDGRGIPADSTFLHLLARAYADALEPAIERGLPEAYVQQEELVQSAQGKLLTDRLYPQALTDPAALWFETSKLTSETPLGNLLRWAAQRFSELVSSPSLRNRLLALVASLAEAESVKPSRSQLERMVLSPQHRQYEQPFRLARWLAYRQGPSLSPGEVEVPGVLLRSRDVYQGFVAACLRRLAVREPNWTYIDEPPLHLTEDETLHPIRPDHVLQTEVGPIVLDSKYKGTRHSATTGGHSILSQDVYQVMAGGRIEGAARVVLVYPTLPAQGEGPFLLKGDQNPAVLFAISVNPAEFDTSDVEAYIDRVRDSLEPVLRWSEGEAVNGQLVPDTA